MKLKHFLDKTNIKHSFKNISSKDTKSYEYEIYNLRKKYILRETDEGIYVYNLKNVPKLDLDLDNLTMEGFLKSIKVAHREVLHSKGLKYMGNGYYAWTDVNDSF